MSDRPDLLLELVRAERGDDPFAFAWGTNTYHRRGADRSIRVGTLSWDGDLADAIAGLSARTPDPEQTAALASMMDHFARDLGWDADAKRISAREDGDDRMEIAFRFGAAELFALPWELLSIGSSGARLGTVPWVDIRYEWAEERQISPAARTRGRLLFAWSAAGGAVPAGEHLDALVTATRAGPGTVAFDPAGDVLEGCSGGALRRRLREASEAGEPYSAVHLLAHTAQAGHIGLCLDGEQSVVDAASLREIWVPHSQQLELLTLCACRGGSPAGPDAHLGSLALESHRAGVRAVLASRFPMSTTGSVIATRTLYRGLLSTTRPLALGHAVAMTRRELREHDHSADALGLLRFSRRGGSGERPFPIRPFRGLSAFRQRDRAFFFGREAEIEELCAEVEALSRDEHPRFYLVEGSSGIGKSSLVLAGALPRWSAAADTEVAYLTPGNDPLDALQRAVGDRADDGVRLAVVVDQLEEVFTQLPQGPLGREQRDAFLGRLWQLAQDDRGTTVIATLRSDFRRAASDAQLAEGLPFDQLFRSGWERHTLYVSQLGGPELRQAVEGPAAVVGLRLADGLTQRIVNDVGAHAGALPLLQFALDQMWERRDDETLTQSSYDALGGVAGALSRRAEAAVDELPPAEQSEARRILTALARPPTDGSPQWTRWRRLEEDVRPTAPKHQAYERAAAALVRARLLTRGDADGDATMELTHEALLVAWPRLQRWLDEDGERLRAVAEVETWAQMWHRYPGDAPLTGSRLQRAMEVAARHPDDVSPVVRAMLDAPRPSDDPLIAGLGLLGGLVGGMALMVYGRFGLPRYLLVGNAGVAAAPAWAVLIVATLLAGTAAGILARGPRLRAGVATGVLSAAAAYVAGGFLALCLRANRAYIEHIVAGGHGLDERASTTAMTDALLTSALTAWGGLALLVVLGGLLGAMGAGFAAVFRRHTPVEVVPHDLLRCIAAWHLLVVSSLVLQVSRNPILALINAMADSIGQADQALAQPLLAGSLYTIGAVPLLGAALAHWLGWPAIVRVARRSRRAGLGLAGIAVLTALALTSMTLLPREFGPGTLLDAIWLLALAIVGLLWAAREWRVARPAPTPATSPTGSLIGAAAAIALALQTSTPLQAYSLANAYIARAGIRPILDGTPIPRDLVEGWLEAPWYLMALFQASLVALAAASAGLVVVPMLAWQAWRRSSWRIAPVAMLWAACCWGIVYCVMYPAPSFLASWQPEYIDPEWQWPLLPEEDQAAGGALLGANAARGRAQLESAEASDLPTAVVLALLRELDDIPADLAWQGARELAENDETPLAPVVQSWPEKTRELLAQSGISVEKEWLERALYGWSVMRSPPTEPDSTVDDPLEPYGNKRALRALLAVRSAAGPGVPDAADLSQTDAVLHEVESWTGRPESWQRTEQMWLSLRAGEPRVARARVPPRAVLTERASALELATVVGVARAVGDDSLQETADAALRKILDDSRRNDPRRYAGIAPLSRLAAITAAHGDHRQALSLLAREIDGAAEHGYPIDRLALAHLEHEIRLAIGSEQPSTWTRLDPPRPFVPRDECSAAGVAGVEGDADAWARILQLDGPCHFAGRHQLWRNVAEERLAADEPQPDIE